MESKKILQADYLDIVFDNRNKAYGGYLLRKDYAHRTRKALAFVVLTTTLLLGYFSWLTHRSPAAIINMATTRVAELTDIKIHELQKQIIQPPPPPAPQKIQTKIIPTNTTLVISPSNQVLPTEHPVTTPVGNPHIGPSSPTGDIHSTSTTPATKITISITTTSKIQDYVEIMPAFPGDIYKYIGDHMRYPDEAKRVGMEGKLYVKFVVNEDGSISDAKVVRGESGYGLGDEAVRVISGMPKWKPGRQNNIAVKVYYTIPIVFVLQ